MALGSVHVLEAAAHDSRVPRQLTAGLLGVDLLANHTPSATVWTPGNGIVDVNDYLVKQNGTPDMSVLIEGGYAFVRGSFAEYNQGVYGVPNDGEVGLSIGNSDPTNPRDDLIILQVRDDTWGGSGGFNDTRLLVVQGTPAVTPVDPSLTSFGTCLVFARVRVGAGVTSVTNANITDLRLPVILGGIGKGIAAKRPTAPAASLAGTQWYSTDTDVLSVWDGDSWETVYEPSVAWIDVSAFSNGWLNFDASRLAGYRKVGDRVYLRGVIKSGTIGFVSAFTLPVGYRPATSSVSFAVNANNAFGAVEVSSAGSVQIVAGSNVYVFLDNVSFATV